MARRKNGRRCSFESLESRELLAGNVTFKIVKGNAVIKGDKLANVVVVTSPVAGSITVAGDATTTINGGAVPITLTGFTGALKIDLGKGADNLTVGSVAAGAITLATGAGAKSTVSAGKGNDTVLLQNTDFNGPLTVGLSGGNDNLTMTNMGVTGLALIRGRAGADTVTIQKGVAAGAISQYDTLQVGLGTKNDSLTIADTTVTVKTTVNGGRGTNTFTQTGTNSLAALRAKNFA